MKKLIAILLCCVLLFGMAACQKPAPTQTAADLLDLGEKFLLELDYEQALVQFLKVIEIEPMNPRGYTGAAEAYIGLGDIENVKAILKQGLGALPDNTEIQRKLAGLESNTAGITPPSLEQYIGAYSTNHREDRGENPEHSAGYDLVIHSISDGEISFSMSYIGNYWSPIYETDVITATLNGNISDFQWTDSWENEGHGTIRLEGGNVIVRMIETTSSELNRASFDTGNEILLTLNGITIDEQDSALAVELDILLTPEQLNYLQPLENAVLAADYETAYSILVSSGLRSFFAELSSGDNISYKNDETGFWRLRCITAQNSPDRELDEGYSNCSIGAKMTDGSTHWFDCFTSSTGYGSIFRVYDANGETTRSIVFDGETTRMYEGEPQ